MASKDKANISYTFTAPHLSADRRCFSVNHGGAPAVPNHDRPPIGPEIGPDPRNMTAKLNLPNRPVILDESSQVRYDFLFGFRVEIPAVPGNYVLRVYDLDANLLMSEFSLQAGMVVVGDRKYFIRYRLTVERDGQLIFLHDYDCTGKNVMVVVPDGALGDNLAWMPFAEAFREEHHARVTCVCGEWLIRLVKEQYPELSFAPVMTRPEMTGVYACYFCAIFPKDRKNWRPSDHQNFGMQGSIAKILQVRDVPRKIRFKLDAPRPCPEPYVCISAMATNPAKHWNYPDGWNDLCRYLKRIGYRVFVIDRESSLIFNGVRYAVPSEAEDATGLKPLSERIAMLQHAAFFVGLPSGLSWLAWNCNIPVVLLAGFTLEGSEFPTPYRVTNFNFCHGCWNDSHLFFDSSLPVWCPRHVGTPREIECTRAITPTMVIDTVNRIPDAAKRLEAVRTILPVVSVIITSKHGEYLPVAIDSITRMLSRSKVPAEIVLYDDGSEDAESQMRLDRLQGSYPDVLRVFRGRQSLGAALGRNEAIRHARGEYLLIFDDDDVMLPFDLRRSIDYLEAHPETPLSYAPKYLFSQESGYLNQIHGIPHSLIEAAFAPKVNINAALVRKSACDALGGFRPVAGDARGLGEDTEFIIRLGLRGPLHYDKEPRCLYRIHHRQLTNGNSDWNRAITQGVVDAYPELYQRILKGDIPDVHGKDFRVVRALMGAAYFLNQTNRVITTPILESARRELPDDFGTWDLYLFSLAQDNREAEMLQAYRTAAARFADYPRVVCQLMQAICLYYQLKQRPLPQSFRDFQMEIMRRSLQPPEIVQQELLRIGAGKTGQ